MAILLETLRKDRSLSISYVIGRDKVKVCRCNITDSDLT